MEAHVQAVLEQAQQLTTEEQLELIEALAHVLQRQGRITQPSSFWHPPTLDELAAQQQPRTFTSLAELVMPDWPTDEQTDHMIDFFHQQRKQDRKAS